LTWTHYPFSSFVSIALLIFPLIWVPPDTRSCGLASGISPNAALAPATALTRKDSVPPNTQSTPLLSLRLQPWRYTWVRTFLWCHLVDIGSNSNPQVCLLSLAQQPPRGCIGPGQCAGWVLFLQGIEMGRSSFPSGLSPSQSLSETRGQPTPSHSIQTLSPPPTFS